MSPAELREALADLEDATPTVMPDGRMRTPHGTAWRTAGVHRRGATPGGAVVQWYETLVEWMARMPEAA